MPGYKIRVLIRSIDDEREWFDKEKDTVEIVGVMRSPEEDMKEVGKTIMEMLRKMVNEPSPDLSGEPRALSDFEE